eukprot:COSAG04_NODE_2040_length_4948_cov_1.674572_5_plen_200_part_00
MTEDPLDRLMPVRRWCSVHVLLWNLQANDFAITGACVSCLQVDGFADEAECAAIIAAGRLDMHYSKVTSPDQPSVWLEQQARCYSNSQCAVPIPTAETKRSPPGFSLTRGCRSLSERSSAAGANRLGFCSRRSGARRRATRWRAPSATTAPRRTCTTTSMRPLCAGCSSGPPRQYPDDFLLTVSVVWLRLLACRRSHAS